MLGNSGHEILRFPPRLAGLCSALNAQRGVADKRSYLAVRQVRSARFRGQSLTGDSDLDSRLAFGGGLGRTDRRYGRRVGSDRGAAAA